MPRNPGTCRWIGSLLAVLSVTLLAAEHFYPAQWRQLQSGIGPVAALTLLEFALSGGAIALGPSRAMSGLGASIILIAASALFQSALGWGSGDEPWRHAGAAVGASRMSFATSLAFVATGFSCVFIPRLGRRGGIALALGLLGLVFSLSMIGIAAHLMDIPLWDVESAGDTSKSLPTALGLLWVTFGMARHVAASEGLQRFYEEHPDRRILVRAVVVAAMLVLATGLLTGAIVARNSIAALGRTLAEIRDTNALLLNVAIHEAERQGRLVANTAKDADDDWVVRHLARSGTDSVLAVWEDKPNGVRRMLAGTDSAEPRVAIPLDGAGTSQLMWDGRWIVEVRDGRFVAQIGVSGLEQLFKYSPELGSSSDVVICAKHGHGIVFFPTRLNPQPFVRETTLNAEGDLFPASRALEGRTETVIARDYRGQEVFAAVAPIANGKLGIVQKIDTAEALAPLRSEFWKALTLTLMLLGLGALLLRRYVHPLVIDLRAAKAEVSQSHAQLQLLAAHMEEAREEEQKRIARDIHDEMGGTLAAIDMHVHQMAAEVRPEMGALAGELGLLQALGVSALASMRKVVSQLRPTALDDLGLSAAIDQCAADFEANSGIACRRNLVQDTAMLSDTESTMIFRILQESLNNVAKHSHATQAEVVLEMNGESMVLQVRDNGCGFDPQVARADCFGLLGMRERARIIGASIEISSGPGEGTCVSISLPVEHAEKSHS
jgi:signal transduction histidine kinase